MNSSLYASYKVMENNEGQAVQTISSREVADMMDYMQVTKLWRTMKDKQFKQ